LKIFNIDHALYFIIEKFSNSLPKKIHLQASQFALDVSLLSYPVFKEQTIFFMMIIIQKKYVSFHREKSSLLR